MFKSAKTYAAISTDETVFRFESRRVSEKKLFGINGKSLAVLSV